MTGKVKWFNEARGFGFITAGGGEDYFLHITKLASRGRIPCTGDAVEFDVQMNPRGPHAVRVKILAPVGEGA